jgi:hypothetical protein
MQDRWTISTKPLHFALGVEYGGGASTGLNTYQNVKRNVKITKKKTLLKSEKCA